MVKMASSLMKGSVQDRVRRGLMSQKKCGISWSAQKDRLFIKSVCRREWRVFMIQDADTRRTQSPGLMTMM